MGVLHALLHPEYQRTCSECGYTWSVPRSYRTMHPTGLPTGFRGAGLGAATAGSFDAMQDTNAQTAEVVTRYMTCAQCGSRHHAQRRIWT